MSKNKKIPVDGVANIFDLANWFLSKEAMTNKKLQKMCYYAVAWGWALMGRAIVEDSSFEAWIHGPVSKMLYEKYKSYGWNLIDKYNDEVFNFDNAVKELLDSVWFTYGDKDGNELEAISHAEQPWREARGGLKPEDPCDKKINEQTMKNFYWSIYNGKSEGA